MRFEFVTAHAFGPFRNETLTLAPGMNVIHGPNESGKSSWHAALQTALCGIKLKGPQRNEVREFKRRRRPWQGADDWDVETVIALVDGRRIELRQDLANENGSARDADIATRDYSAQIEADGMPDGSRWLGLDRVSFLNIACVRQAEMLAVRDGADKLQSALQKAADKADMDHTAGEALLLLAKYRRFEIGSTAAPTKPLRLAMAAVSSARNGLDNARRDSDEHLRKQRDVKRLESAVTKQQRRIKALQAHQADETARKAEQRLERTRELKKSVGDGPPIAINDADLADQVAEALAAWRNAPNPAQPLGATREDLARQRADLADEKAQIEDAKLKWRPAIGLLLSGLGLLAATAWCLSTQQPFALTLGTFAAGLAAIWWAFARGRRHAREGREERLRELAQAVRNIEGDIAHRGEADSAYENAMALRKNAREGLALATSTVGLPQSAPDEQTAALGYWQTERRQRLARTAEQTQEWGELQRLMAGLSHEEIEREAIAKRQEADALLAECDRSHLQAARSSVEDLATLQNAETEARERLDNARGALEQFAKGMASVADAEDDLDAAKRQLQRLETLDQTLATTIQFLEQAQERVHRDMARVLRATLNDWLPRTTAGRYTECRVDPQTLAVEVRDAEGDWRDADLLSHGTTEQIYLLLRLALCQHLVAEGESCPLILDDPVSGCDSQRRQSVLETLLAVGASAQVIVFTHDDDVLDWGHRHLSGDKNKVIELAGPDSQESSVEPLGTSIANRFRGGGLEAPVDELRARRN